MSDTPRTDAAELGPNDVSPKPVVLADFARQLERENAELREALQEVAMGEGAFNLNPLKHAQNCIENMREIARAVLAKAKP